MSARRASTGASSRNRRPDIDEAPGRRSGQARAGRRSRCGVAFSNASAARSTVASWNGLPTSWIATGRPPAPKPGAYRHRRVAGDVERHHEARRAERVPFRHGVDLRRLVRKHRGQHEVEIGHRRLQFGAQFAPPPHRLHVVHPRHERAEHQPAAHALAEIGQPRPRPFLVGRGALGDRDQRAAGRPILQRRQLHLADLGAEIAERGDRLGDAALGALADLVVDLVEMMDDADPEPLDAAAQRGAVVGDGPVGARRVARVVAGKRLQHDRAILGRPRHRPDMVER